MNNIEHPVKSSPYATGQMGGPPEVGGPVHLHTLHISKATTAPQSS